MSTYNAYFNKSAKLGEHIPIWLGKVIPMNVGAKLDAAYAKAGAFFPAGMPMQYADGVATPFIAWEIVSCDTSTHAITVKANPLGYLPKASDVLGIVGATFAAAGAAAVVSSVAAGTTAGQHVITMATSALDATAVAGAVLTFSAATSAAASGKSLKVQPNCYLYNDIAIDPVAYDESIDTIGASAALVNFHGQGVRINLTPAACVKAAMKAAVPNVIQEER